MIRFQNSSILLSLMKIPKYYIETCQQISQLITYMQIKKLNTLQTGGYSKNLDIKSSIPQKRQWQPTNMRPLEMLYMQVRIPHIENVRNLTVYSLWFWSLETKQLFKTIEQNQNFNRKRKNPMTFTTGIFCIFSFIIFFSLLPCFKKHGPHSHTIYYKNIGAKGFFWLSWLRALKGHPEKSQLEKSWNSCGEMAAIWKGTVLADCSIESNVSSPTNTPLFNFSHRGEYRALVVGCSLYLF